MDLVLERKNQPNETVVFGDGVAALSPAVDENYWEYRVLLTETQAVVGFPKYSTIGIGFAFEQNWNTNLPYTCSTDKIFNHIIENKGDERISDEDVRQAIELVQDAARADLEQVSA